MPSTKSAGSRTYGSSPCGRTGAVADSVVPELVGPPPAGLSFPPHAATATRSVETASARSGRRMLVGVPRPFLIAPPVVVGFASDDVEVAVEVHLDLSAVLATDLDTVGGSVVSALGLDDRAAPRVRERGVRGLLQGRAGQGLFVPAARGDRDRRRRAADHDDEGEGGDEQELAIHMASLVGWDRQ